jgi:hypothetical protein
LQDGDARGQTISRTALCFDRKRLAFQSAVHAKPPRINHAAFRHRRVNGRPQASAHHRASAGTVLANTPTATSKCPIPARRAWGCSATMSVLIQLMNVHPTYSLTSPIDANRFLRRWTSLSRTAFCGTILLADIAVIVSMAWLTGVTYHYFAYREIGDIVSYLEVGLLTAMIYAIANLFRGEYKLPNFFAFKPHLRRSIQLWNVTFICLMALGFLAKITVVYSRGWFILYYASTICILLMLRYLFVQATVHGSRIGILSAQRIFFSAPAGISTIS